MENLEFLLNKDMGSTADWLEVNSHKYALLDINSAKNQDEVFNFISSWAHEIPELLESSSGKSLEFFDSLSDILSDQKEA